MASIVVLGAGLGGMAAAYEIRAALDARHHVTVIGDGPRFNFTPSNPWVAVGWRTLAEIGLPVGEPLGKHGIDFIPVPAEAVLPGERSLRLRDGRRVDYDYLVIATGPRLAFDEVPGLGPEGHTHSICTGPHAEEAWQAYQALLENPGPVVIGAVQGASCFGPAYEFAMILDADLRRRKLRHRVPITLVTAEPYIGHLGLGGVGDSKGLLESALRQKDIKWIVNARVSEVTADKVKADELDAHGTVVQAHELPCAYAMFIPAFTGVAAVRGIEGLVNPRGFVLIDKHQCNPTWPNIYAAGVCVAIPPVEATPVPTGAPKTGFMIESMVRAVAQNLRAELNGKPATAQATWNAVCLADMGETGAAFVALPQIPPRNVTWARTGKWVHLAKIAFERYYLHKVRAGTTEPIYEKYVLKALGIGHLQSEDKGHAA